MERPTLPAITTDQAATLRRLLDHPTLDPDEARKLCTRAQAGDQTARERLITQHLRLVAKVAHGYGSALSLDDRFGEGVIGLIAAVDKYDTAARSPFAAYATIWINQAINRAISNTARTIRLPEAERYKLAALRGALEESDGATVGELAAAADLKEEDVLHLLPHASGVASLDEPITNQPDAPSRGALISAPQPSDEPMADTAVDAALERLPAEQAETIRLRYGIDRPMLTQDEAAAELGTHDKRLRSWQRAGEQALSEDGELRTAVGL